MKKTVLSLTLLLSTLLAGSVMAQTPQAACCDKAKTEKCAQQDSCCATQQRQRPTPFDGITLTPEQKAALEALKPARADKKAPVAKERKDPKASRAEYLAKVKEILTPEQYVQFLENSYTSQVPVMSPRMSQSAKAGRHTGKASPRDAKKIRKPDRKQARQTMKAAPEAEAK
ncbi:MAG: hypothetical protein J1E29_04565 [Duncaniella sp.]|nr:hypothetical protein [Duncaniella sp.]